MDTAAPESAAHSHDRTVIALVDDDRNILTTVSIALQAEGFATRVYSDGETALKALRPHVMGRIVAIVGAGGDRDRGKRPLMGEAARQFADVVIVTDDNPRTEDPAAIRAAVMEGAGPDATEVADRAEAILRGVDALLPGDALLICGKGHETGQIIGNDIYPFDDAEQASVAVAALDGKI